MGNNLSVLTIIALIADLLAISSFVFGILIKRDYNNLGFKMLIIFMAFVFAIGLYFLTPKQGLDINTDALLRIAAFLYLLIATISVLLTSWLFYCKRFSYKDFIHFILSSFIPFILGTFILLIVKGSVDDVAVMFFGASIFQIILMVKNYIINKLIYNIVEDDNSKVSSIHGKTSFLKVNSREFIPELIFALIPYSLGILFLLLTSSDYSNRVNEIFEKFRKGNNSEIGKNIRSKKSTTDTSTAEIYAPVKKENNIPKPTFSAYTSKYEEVNIRTSPELAKSNILEKIPKNSLVRIDSIRNDYFSFKQGNTKWFKIQFEETSGWVVGHFVRYGSNLEKSLEKETKKDIHFYLLPDTNTIQEDICFSKSKILLEMENNDFYFGYCIKNNKIQLTGYILKEAIN